MKKYRTILAIFALLGLAALVFTLVSRTMTPNAGKETSNNPDYSNATPGSMISLPAPLTDGAVSLEQALKLRRSIRSYTNEPLNLTEVGQLLWSAQGVTNERGFRTAPSAGATFPLEMFLVAVNIEGLKPGIYHYKPSDHQLEYLREGDFSEQLYHACLSQSMLLDGGATLVFAADFERTTNRYGERGIRYVHNEIGHASQNVHLQAAVLDLGTVVIGAYRDDEVEEILQLGEPYRVLYLMPVGKM